MVELDVWATALETGCTLCGKPLPLSNCFDETVSRLGSFLCNNCIDCGEINVCRTNKDPQMLRANGNVSKYQLCRYILKNRNSSNFVR